MEKKEENIGGHKTVVLAWLEIEEIISLMSLQWNT